MDKRTAMSEDVKSILKQTDAILYIHRKIIEEITRERPVIHMQTMSKEELLQNYEKMVGGIQGG